MNYLFAIPVRGDVVDEHFGKAREFCFISVTDREIKAKDHFRSPEHDLGKIPTWLAGQNVTHVFAMGIGQIAIEILNDYNIEVIWGVPEDKPELLVKAYLDSQLVPGINLCDH